MFSEIFYGNRSHHFGHNERVKKNKIKGFYWKYIQKKMTTDQVFESFKYMLPQQEVTLSRKWGKPVNLLHLQVFSSCFCLLIKHKEPSSTTVSLDFLSKLGSLFAGSYIWAGISFIPRKSVSWGWPTTWKQLSVAHNSGMLTVNNKWS